MKYTLELNVEEQLWHYNNGNNVPNSNGYVTIVEDEEDGKLTLFTDFFDVCVSYGTVAEALMLWKAFNCGYEKLSYAEESSKLPLVEKQRN